MTTNGSGMMREFDYTSGLKWLLAVAMVVLVSACGSTPTQVGEDGAETPKAVFDERAYDDGVALMKKKKYEEAISTFEKVVRNDSSRAGPYINMGIAYRELGKYEEAKKVLISATKANPDSEIAFNELGLVHRKLGEFDKAKSAYKKSIDNRSRYSPAYKNLGILCDIYLQDMRCAIRNYERYQSLTKGEDKTVGFWIVDLKKRMSKPAKGK
jgi:tetratricopeptide (TPR) repeat protein